MASPDEQMVGLGSLMAISALIWIMIKTGGFSALTTEGGILYLTTVASIVLSLGRLIPSNLRRFVAIAVLLLGGLIFINLVMGIHLFGLRLVNL